MSSRKSGRSGTPVRESASAAQIAVIGMACRLPRASDPEGFWTLLRDGVDAVGEVPAGRWPEGTAAGYRRGGFLDQVDRFDAGFFGVSPHEAAAMDPQQRLMLELAWEACEHARIAPDRLRGSDTGVFVGAIAADYAALADRLGAAALSSHTLAGVQRGIIANRVSYVLGLRGRSITVDTGQSSSLVAVQSACEDLRRGDSRIALAGGVNLNLLPETTEAISRFGALSPDGRCHTFDGRANGYVRGEGGALLVLKPLPDALADGDTVHCVILGGAVNNDGGGAGLTVPDANAQREVIRSAWRRAGVGAAEVQYVELHGTGTAVGDPVEAAALGGALAEGRDTAEGSDSAEGCDSTEGRDGADPLLVGSVKTNIGHLEGAAGIAGLLKVVLSLAHRELAPSLNFTTASPRIPLAELRLDVVREPRAWPRPDRRLVAGVSSFGMGGTNCHLVLAEAPAEAFAAVAEPVPAATRPGAVVLSARSADALRGQARSLSDRLDPSSNTDTDTDAETADVALSLIRTRTRFEHRAVLLGTERSALKAGLNALAENRPDPAVVTGRAAPGGVALVFPGQGSQWPGMARGLLDGSCPVFERRLDECAQALEPHLGYALPDVLRERPGAPDLSRVEVAQPALWAVTVALAELWRSWGVRPDIVIGHSEGEIAAATAIGALRLEDAALVIAQRSLAPEEKLLAALASIRPKSVPTTFVSSVTGEPIDTAELDADYWVGNLRQPVRFGEAVRRAIALGAGLFIESSPHPVLVAAVEEAAEADGVAVVSTLRHEQDGPDRLRLARAEAFVAGADIVWDEDCAVPGARLVDLPTYAFHRERHWLAGVSRPVQPAAAPAAVRSRTEVRELVADSAALVLGHADRRAIDQTRSFKDLGFDSAGTVELCQRLRSLTGLRLTTSAVYDFPTPKRLADHLHTRQAETAGRAEPGASSASSVSSLLSASSTSSTSRASIAPPVHDLPAPADSDAIAVVAIGCRYPGGVESAADLWRLVSGGTDAITALPADRGWDLDALLGSGPDRPGTCATGFGGFLHGADRFDAAFFGLSPREALAMDPQQRLLLETAWEALERAGLDPTGLEGSPVGVFVGAMAAEYGPRLHRPTGVADGHLLTGTALSVASGRIAYTFGFQGPALTVDTACSSSLVAVMLAVQALRRGECPLALAGGVTLMANPGHLVEFSRQNGLAPDGRAKAFSASADGTAFAEGAGMLLLERLGDARRAGHPVLAVIRGGAVNSDGASNGLTAPNGRAQQDVIRRALADAGLAAHEVDVVEAHGTGTALGDPVEAHAIAATYGRAHSDAAPVWLGSVKSNIGHTQAAAGVAGVIKMVMAMRHELLPRTLYVEEPTHEVDWDAGGVRLLAEDRPWPRQDRPRRAAVSSFGISGTNAHLIIESVDGEPSQTLAEAEPAGDPTVAGPLVWMFSARSAASLRKYADRLAAFANDTGDDDDADDSTLIATGPALARRTLFPHRAVVVAGDRAQLCAALEDLAAERPNPAAWTAIASPHAEPVFVFPGQGSQWHGMAAELARTDEVFAANLRRCDEALAPHTGWSVLDVLHGAEDAPAMQGSDVIQPVLFAVTIALAALWQAAGIRPAAVVGHSMGEIAASHLAGALSLADAAKLVAARSQVIGSIDGTGAMLSAVSSAARIHELLQPWADRLWIALRNGPNSTVIGGDPDAVEEFTQRWGESIQLRRAALAYAAHTPHIARVRDELYRKLGVITPSGADIPILSSYLGGRVDPATLGTDHWYESLACQVRFDEAVRAASAGLESPLFIEVSPHPILCGDVEDILAEAGVDGAAVGSLRRDSGGRRQFLAAAAQAWVRGAAVDWHALLGSADRHRHVEPPAYAFDRQRFWLASTEGTESTDHASTTAPRHPLFDSIVAVAQDDRILLSGRLSLPASPWLAEHTIGGVVLLPATGFAELALQAADAAGAEWIEELTLHTPLAPRETGAMDVQVTVGAADASDRRSLSVHSRPSDDPGAEWTANASGQLGTGDRAPAAEAVLAAWPPADAVPVDLEDLYPRLADTGYEYGPLFQGLQAAWRTEDGFCAEVRLPAGAVPHAGAFALHPALFDAVLHILVLDAMSAAPDAGLLLPFSWSGLDVAVTGAESLRVRLTGRSDSAVTLDLFDSAGRRVGGVESLALRRVPADRALGGSAASGLYDFTWSPTRLSEAELEGRHWAVLGDGAESAAITAALKEFGADIEHFDDLSALASAPRRELPAVVIVPCAADAVREALLPMLELVQQWAADERFTEPQLLVLADRTTPAGAAVWGLMRCVQAEYPGRFVIADPGLLGGQVRDRAAWRLVAAGLDAAQSQFAVDGGQLLTPRLARHSATVAPAELSESTDLSEGTVLVTGATGGIGALVAQRLVTDHGVRDLLLVSRTGDAAPGAGDLAARLTELGARVRIEACDVADRAALIALLDSVPADRPLVGVVHAAGVLDDALVAGLTPDRCVTVLRPKADAAWLLHELTADLPLRAFVLFSSVVGVLGNAGQANYGAANAVLDALSAHRRSLGLPAIAIAWGPWTVGMTAGLTKADEARFARSGLAALDAAAGLELFDAALVSSATGVVAAKWDREALRRAADQGTEIPVAVRALLPTRRRAATSPDNPENPGAPATTADRLTGLSRPEALEVLLDVVRRNVAVALAHDSAQAVDVERPFSDLGFDSLSSVELRRALGEEIGRRLPATLLFDRPTVAAVAEYLAQELAADDPDVEPAVEDLLRDALDRALDRLGAEDAGQDQRARVAAVLDAALARLGGPQRAGGGADRFDGVSDEEIFQFIEQL
ncbi:type I polyketide synthase [Catenulispora rubra]|uniref:type I polyketide synthase n=1 Tax=Catenulispora rubra TaxID=280293 RepID=UPI00189203FD|nr:type I polyketide synthase [Catenulispora rubra]